MAFSEIVCRHFSTHRNQIGTTRRLLTRSCLEEMWIGHDRVIVLKLYYYCVYSDMYGIEIIDYLPRFEFLGIVFLFLVMILFEFISCYDFLFQFISCYDFLFVSDIDERGRSPSAEVPAESGLGGMTTIP